MRMSKFAAALALGISALSLAGCETGFPARVSRYQAMPAPQGQSFVVVPMDARNAGGLEFSRYAAIVSQAMQAYGYAPAATPGQATMLVHLGYNVDNGEEVIDSDPFYRGYGYGGLGYGGYYGRPYYSRFGYYRASPFYYGWDDPFWGPSYARSYTVYKSNLELQIRRKVDNASLFEGRARARSHTDNLAVLVPNLVEAMFTGFPGHSGETVKITVPSPNRRAPVTRP